MMVDVRTKKGSIYNYRYDTGWRMFTDSLRLNCLSYPCTEEEQMARTRCPRGSDVPVKQLLKKLNDGYNRSMVVKIWP